MRNLSGTLAISDHFHACNSYQRFGQCLNVAMQYALQWFGMVDVNM